MVLKATFTGRSDQLKFTIATANSRKEKHWKNKEMTWTEFIERLKSPIRTNETVVEYRKMSKTEQDEIKDVGGFVAGKLIDGIRKNGYIKNRSMLTLDMDYARPDTWEYIKLFNDYTCCLYSTHKHVPDYPRLRLIIPLSRAVSADEYQAVSRKVAEDIGIEQFDDTTYEPTRLMYWPSASSDSEYVFKQQDGELLDPDKILTTYEDWTNVATWPVSSRMKEALHKSIEKQSDPKEKEGIVGAFCRTYCIEDVIEKYLSDIYTPCDIPNRYTYVSGSTSGGLILYDNGNFAYSHHSTDPAGGKLCNAFDLVRFHKFKDLDKDIDVSQTKLPSFQAMQELAVNDVLVKKQLVEDRLANAIEDFSEKLNWTEKLEYKKDGTLLATINNITLILENDPNLITTVGYNEFAHRNELIRDLPWRKKGKDVYWNDTDDAALRHYLEHVYGINHSSKTMDALAVVTLHHQFNPVKEYLESLKWDGVKRLDSLLIDYFNAEDNAYARAVTRKALVAAVARIFEPGCKFDYILLLVGEQGLGKSYFINKLGGKWYSDSLTTVMGKEAYEQLQGVWILELGELSATKKADIEAIKHFVSKQEDIFREAYGRRTKVFARQCIFIGTTNEKESLKDKTGNRRFWPVNVSEGRLDLWHELNVDQIWAEAVDAYHLGEELYLRDSVAKEAMKIQEMHTEESDKTGLVLEYLDRLLPDTWDELDLSARRMYLAGDFTNGEGTIKRNRVCAMEVWCECFGGDPKQLSYLQAREIRSILDNMDGWQRYNGDSVLRFKIYGRQRAYTRI